MTLDTILTGFYLSFLLNSAPSEAKVKPSAPSSCNTNHYRHKVKFMQLQTEGPLLQTEPG